MAKRIDLVGQKFGRLTVVSFSHSSTQRKSYWLCQCDCNNSCVVAGGHLRGGRIRSCGCFQRERASEVAKRQRKYELKDHPLFNTWQGMIGRCYCQTHSEYHRYGARGITVCDRWLGIDGFKNFLADMGEKPSPQHSLDRKGNHLGYSPDNCRWATRIEQCNNRRNNHILTIDGVSKTVAEWAREKNLRDNTVRDRLRAGWAPKEALETPIGTRKQVG